MTLSVGFNPTNPSTPIRLSGAKTPVFGASLDVLNKLCQPAVDKPEEDEFLRNCYRHRHTDSYETELPGSGSIEARLLGVLLNNAPKYSGKNPFVLGGAGTGKTTMVNYIRSQIPQDVPVLRTGGFIPSLGEITQFVANHTDQPIVLHLAGEAGLMFLDADPRPFFEEALHDNPGFKVFGESIPDYVDILDEDMQESFDAIFPPKYRVTLNQPSSDEAVDMVAGGVAHAGFRVDDALWDRVKASIFNKKTSGPRHYLGRLASIFRRQHPAHQDSPLKQPLTAPVTTLTEVFDLDTLLQQKEIAPDAQGRPRPIK